MVQFVDFGARIIREVHEVYNSASGFTDKHQELLISAHGLKNNADVLSSNTLWEETSSVNQQYLKSLLNACHTLADKLITVIEDLKVEASERAWIKKLTTLRQGVRAASRKSAINDLVKRMQLLRDTLNSRLLAMLRYAPGPYD